MHRCVTGQLLKPSLLDRASVPVASRELPCLLIAHEQQFCLYRLLKQYNRLCTAHQHHHGWGGSVALEGKMESPPCHNRSLVTHLQIPRQQSTMPMLMSSLMMRKPL